ncbi:hypothetical protein K432DRAFT_395469 [Lepidopterella palustris CBS 459.81]|uniref:Uncharacterized protein n=1 Tax=Lepidopterella palustris CBS 459.81 TaxID=1314670 RepID=A0A8E2E5F8_9PEZI|nr:hypothetical protein K432DRAFT_395469 [Lepidopterella palustris CBS 459.81]
MATLIVEAALIANFGASKNQAALQAAVAMFYIFQIPYGFCLDGTQFSYLGEQFHTHLRAKGTPKVYLSKKRRHYLETRQRDSYIYDNEITGHHADSKEKQEYIEDVGTGDAEKTAELASGSTKLEVLRP